VSPGRFITLEGIEGAGKSTAAKFIGTRLRAAGIPVLATREPGGTPLAERIRQIVLERGTETVTPMTETLLMFAARALHVTHVIRPALTRGEWVVCDRFTDATCAYQGGGRGVDGELIAQLAHAVHGDLKPALTLLLDLPVATGLARARARAGAATDRFEAETVAFFERVRAGYVSIAHAEPKRVRLIDAAAPLEAVEREIATALEPLIKAQLP
jgi:dTMP kinase